MPNRLTDEQIAKRAAAKKNDKLRQKCPLFADYFATTAEAELERIKRQHEESENYLRRVRERSLEAFERAMTHRAAAYAIFPPEKCAELEARLARRLRRDPYDPELGFELADYWWCALKGSAYAEAHCPNRKRHNEKWPPTYNYLYERFTPTTHCPTCGAKLNEA